MSISLNNNNRLLHPSLVFEAGYNAIFDLGTLRCQGQEGTGLKLYANSEKYPVIIDVSGDAYFNELNFFINCFRDGRKFESKVSSEGALDALKLWELECSSIETGKIIEVDF